MHDAEHAVVVDLEDETYKRLVVEVAYPSAVVALLQRHLEAIGRANERA